MKKCLFLCLWILALGTPLYGQVDTVWVRRFNGSGNGTDVAYALALDDSLNVYVTGESSNGQNNDYCTVKYSPTGTLLWSRVYNGSGMSGDAARAVAVDRNRNIFVTGYSWGTNYDFATIKYTPAGDTAWVRRYNGPGNGDDYARALKVDASGNAYVAGYASGSGTGYDFCLLKYAPNGTLLWSRLYHGGGGDDCARALALDSSGNLYVTGESSNGTAHDYLTIKYTSNGDSLWTRRYNGSGNGDDMPSALTPDSSGNLLVTGKSWGSGSDYDFCTIKYAPNGDTLWIRRFNGPGNRTDVAYAVTVDRRGNAFVAGGSDSVSTDYRTIKYSPNGTLLWTRTYDGPWYSYDEIFGAATDTGGNVYVTGYSDGGGIFFDYCTIKYSSTGTRLWLTRYNGPGNYADLANAIALDGAENVYITGQSNGGSSVYDYCTIKYRQIPSGITLGEGELHAPFAVRYLNPIRGRLSIALEGARGAVRMQAFDLAGRKVRELAGQPSGLTWDLRDEEGEPVGCGVYFLRVSAAQGDWMGKVVVVK